MLKKIFSVLLVEDSAEFAELVQRWLSGNQHPEFALNWTDSLAAGLNRLDGGDIDIILLDLGLPDSSGFETFARAHARAGSVPIVLLSSADSETLALRMIQAGAEDYLLKSMCTAELLVKAIRYAVVRSTSRSDGAAPDADRTRVVSVLGAKGGVGTTTAACNLAVALREQTGAPTLLADLDINGGQAAFLLNADCEYSILDAANNLHRLDRAFWESLVGKGPGGLDLVRSPAVHGLGQVDGGKIQQVLSLVRDSYRWMVLDLGRLTNLSMSLLEPGAELFLVTNDSLPALHQAKQVITALGTAGFEPARLHLIVNRMAAANELSPHELNHLFGVEVYGELPKASQDLHAACRNATLPRSDGAYRTEVTRLARRIAGLPLDTPKNAFSLLSIANRLSGKAS